MSNTLELTNIDFGIDADVNDDVEPNNIYDKFFAYLNLMDIDYKTNHTLGEDASPIRHNKELGELYCKWIQIVMTNNNYMNKINDDTIIVYKTSTYDATWALKYSDQKGFYFINSD